MISNLKNFLFDWLTSLGLSEGGALLIKESIGVVFILLVAITGFFIARFFIIRAVHLIVARSKNQWDDILAEKRVFKKLAYLAPAFIINYLTPIFLTDFDILIGIVEFVTSIYMVIVCLNVILALINALLAIYEGFGVSKAKPIKGYGQVAKIIAYILAFVIIITIVLGKNSFAWVAGFGAFSAVLLLVFKDPILGFVGGIQLSANNMVKIGDWIEMPKYGANGTVIDISLTTVKGQNWNKTITTIPTYTMVTDYFTNWRGMEESGGRRIMRSFNIDMNSITFCTPEMLDRFRKIEYVSEYVDKTEKELQAYNKKRNIDNDILVNGKRQTNIGVFRAYLKRYLENDPKLDTKMTFLVRQLEPDSQGLPIQV